MPARKRYKYNKAATPTETPRSCCRRAQAFFTELPHELMLMVVEQVPRNDLISLSLTCRAVRSALLPYLFCSVRSSWESLVSSWNHRSLPVGHPELVEKLRITTHCSKNEWTFPFHELFSASAGENRLVNLCSLELPSSGSTSFFKYCDVGANLTTLTIHALRPSSCFSLEHVKPFANLRELSLAGFEIEEFDESGSLCPKLRNLRLRDCTWCYPFELENFGRDRITKLSLSYSNSFVMSERFRLFLSSPGFTRLEELSITNSERNMKLTVSLHVMALIGSIPTLRVLKLKGNIYNETLNDFTNFDADNYISYVALNNVKVFYSSFFQEAQ